MKSLYESLLTGKVSKPNAKVQPRSKEELEQIIDEHIKRIKPKPGEEVDLNWIDISKVDDLSELFEGTNYIPVIDAWKIDHVKDFRWMFKRNADIVESPFPRMQEKLLEDHCYWCMFQDCVKLKKAPELPATELTDHCYYCMFANCASLEVPPELPATKLKRGCYGSMFLNCISLKVAPVLPATKLAEFCYQSMFHGCKKLKELPKVPSSVKLKDKDYCDNMFKNCPNIK